MLYDSFSHLTDILYLAQVEVEIMENNMSWRDVGVRVCLGEKLASLVSMMNSADVQERTI